LLRLSFEEEVLAITNVEEDIARGREETAEEDETERGAGMVLKADSGFETETGA